MLTQGELAELAGLSVYTVHAAEHGRNVSPKTGRALAAALDIDPSQLLPKAPAPSLEPTSATALPDPEELLQEEGIKTRWLLGSEEDWLAAARGHDKDEAKSNLLRVARESLFEYYALLPRILTERNEFLGHPTLGAEYLEAWREAAQQRVRMSAGLEQILREAKERGEEEPEASLLAAAYRGLSDVELEQLKAATEEFRHRSPA